jgi:2-methylisocitrate lyase-like PEP mutase family enzyme
MSIDDRRSRFRALHARDRIFLMANAWDIGSARLLAARGCEALATTSAGFAWSIGKLDQQVTRDELVEHVAALADATPLPLSVDSECCFPNEPGGVTRTVELLADAGAAGFSIEDYDPVGGRIMDVGPAAERVAEAVAAARSAGDPLVVTARAENLLHGIDDFDDTLARLVAFREAGADAVFAPGLKDLAQISAVVTTVGLPVNVIALPGVPSIGELEAVGVRRISVGSLLAGVAYGAMLAGVDELLSVGTSTYAARRVSADVLKVAFGRTDN